MFGPQMVQSSKSLSILGYFEKKIGPGARVALNQDSLAVVEVLTDAWDPIVSGAEVSGKPDITYSEIGGLDEEIEQILEGCRMAT